MIVGSLAGPLCAGGGFCAGSDEIVEHQRISAAAYTFSAALPAMLATTASETLAMLQATPDILTQVRDNIRTMRTQLDPRSEWVRCSSAADNPVMLLALKPEVIASKRLGVEDQTQLLQDIVDEVSASFPSFQAGPVEGGSGALTKVSGADAGQRGADHPAQEPGSRGRRGGRGATVAAGAQGVRHGRAQPQGGGAGGDDDPARHHQGGQPATVRDGRGWLSRLDRGHHQSSSPSSPLSQSESGHH